MLMKIEWIMQVLRGAGASQKGETMSMRERNVIVRDMHLNEREAGVGGEGKMTMIIARCIRKKLLRRRTTRRS